MGRVSSDPQASVKRGALPHWCTTDAQIVLTIEQAFGYSRAWKEAL